MLSIQLGNTLFSKDLIFGWCVQLEGQWVTISNLPTATLEALSKEPLPLWAQDLSEGFKTAYDDAVVRDLKKVEREKEQAAERLAIRISRGPYDVKRYPTVDYDTLPEGRIAQVALRKIGVDAVVCVCIDPDQISGIVKIDGSVYDNDRKYTNPEVLADILANLPLSGREVTRTIRTDIW